jgi:hypothetical protein
VAAPGFVGSGLRPLPTANVGGYPTRGEARTRPPRDRGCANRGPHVTKSEADLAGLVGTHGPTSAVGPYVSVMSSQPCAVTCACSESRINTVVVADSKIAGPLIWSPGVSVSRR